MKLCHALARKGNGVVRVFMLRSLGFRLGMQSTIDQHLSIHGESKLLTSHAQRIAWRWRCLLLLRCQYVSSSIHPFDDTCPSYVHYIRYLVVCKWLRPTRFVAFSTVLTFLDSKVKGIAG